MNIASAKDFASIVRIGDTLNPRGNLSTTSGNAFFVGTDISVDTTLPGRKVVRELGGSVNGGHFALTDHNGLFCFIMLYANTLKCLLHDIFDYRNRLYHVLRGAASFPAGYTRCCALQHRPNVDKDAVISQIEVCAAGGLGPSTLQRGNPNDKQRKNLHHCQRMFSIQLFSIL